MSDPLPEQTATRIREALASGNKIEAIRLYREFSGVGLAEAKAFIEQLQRGDHAASSGSRTPAAAVTEALFAGNKIEAIKRHREAHGGGLAEAKAAVEQLEAELRRTQPERFSRSPQKGCLVGVLALATLATLARLLG